MANGISLVVYPAQDLEASKKVYNAFFGTEPYADAAYYVGYRVGDVEFGLDPNAGARGITAPVAYCPVDDIRASLKELLAAGAQPHMDVTDVGGGKLIALVRDAAGNFIGITQK